MSPLETGLDSLIDQIADRVADRIVPRLVAALAGAPAADELVPPATFARMRSISVSTVRAAIREGRLPATKIGRAVRIAADAQIGRAVNRPTTNEDTPQMRAAKLWARLHPELGHTDRGGRP